MTPVRDGRTRLGERGFTEPVKVLGTDTWFLVRPWTEDGNEEEGGKRVGTRTCRPVRETGKRLRRNPTTNLYVWIEKKRRQRGRNPKNRYIEGLQREVKGT